MVIGASAGPRIGQFSIGILYLSSAVLPGEAKMNTMRNARNKFFHITNTSYTGKQNGTIIVCPVLF
jgi:hypothetical protein